MAAAVSDYLPKKKSPKAKIKKEKTDLTIELKPTEDILKKIASKTNKIIVGFALETENLIQNAKKKLKDKKLDIIVANGPENFGVSTGSVTIINKNGKSEGFKNVPKKEIAGKILDAILRL